MNAIESLKQRGLKIPVELERMPAPPRAWALAKAAYETAEEASFAEQRELVREITADDPEPPEPKEVNNEEWHAWYEVHKAWYERNNPRWQQRIDAVIARHNIDAFRKLEKAAEQNMVEWAEDRIKTHFGERYAAVKSAFEAYREGRLYGEMHDKFLKICFNFPEKP